MFPCCCGRVLFMLSKLFHRTDEIPGTINDFTAHMEPFLQSFIIRPLYRSGGEQIQTEAVRIAVLDTGFHGDDEDYFLLAAEPRIKLKQNFTGGGSDDCHDYHGHGTHVARLLLRFAPEADIYVAKISASRTLEKTRLDQIANVTHTSHHPAPPDIDWLTICNYCTGTTLGGKACRYHQPLFWSRPGMSRSNIGCGPTK